MARKYDIVERLKAANERPFLVLDEKHVYTINTSKNNVIAMMAMMDEYERQSESGSHTQLEMMDKMISMALGKEASQFIAGREDWTFDALQDVVKAISAAIANTSIEDVEKRNPSTSKKK